MTITYTIEEKINEWTTDVLHAFDRTNELEKLKDITLTTYTEWLQKPSDAPLALDSFTLEEEVKDFLEETDEKTSREQLLNTLFKQISTVCVFINPLDWNMDYHTYQIALSTDNTWYYVYASHEQEALDTLVDYLEQKEWVGYFLDETDIEDEDSVIRAGNHSRALAPDYMVIKEI